MDTSLTSIWRTSSGNIWKHNRHEVSIPLWTFDDLRSSFIVGTHDGPGTAALCKTHGGFPAAAGVDLAVAFVASCRYPGKTMKTKIDIMKTKIKIKLDVTSDGSGMTVMDSLDSDWLFGPPGPGETCGSAGLWSDAGPAKSQVHGGRWGQITLDILGSPFSAHSARSHTLMWFT